MILSTSVSFSIVRTTRQFRMFVPGMLISSLSYPSRYSAACRIPGNFISRFSLRFSRFCLNAPSCICSFSLSSFSPSISY